MGAETSQRFAQRAKGERVGAGLRKAGLPQGAEPFDGVVCRAGGAVAGDRTGEAGPVVERRSR